MIDEKMKAVISALEGLELIVSVNNEISKSYPRFSEDIKVGRKAAVNDICDIKMSCINVIEIAACLALKEELTSFDIGYMTEVYERFLK